MPTRKVLKIKCPDCGHIHSRAEVPVWIECGCGTNFFGEYQKLVDLPAARPLKGRKHRWSQRDFLEWMVVFGFQQVGSAEVVRRADYELLRIEIDRFVTGVGGRDLGGMTMVRVLDDDEIENLRTSVKGGLETTTRGESWSPQLKSVRLATGFGGLEYDGDITDKFILTCMLLISQTPMGLVTKCARSSGSGCGRVLVRQKRTTYCSRYCARLAEAEQARKRRAEPQQKRKQSEQRRRHYETLLSKHGYSQERIQALHQRYLAKRKKPELNSGTEGAIPKSPSPYAHLAKLPNEGWTKDENGKWKRPEGWFDYLREQLR
jgi:hypothetical protein